MTLVIKHSAEASGSGTVTAEDLVTFGSKVPPKTKVFVKQHTKYQSDDGWSMTASWTEEEHNAWQGSKPPSISYPPGVRGTTGGHGVGGSQFGGDSHR